MKILFVCTGNTCRSPMAEGILKDMAKKEGLDLEVKSAGLAVYDGDNAAKNSIEAMREIDIDILNHRSSQLHRGLIEESDLILTMASGHKHGILMDFTMYGNKVFNLLEYAYGRDKDVEDPYGGSLELYRKTRDEIYEAVVEIVKNL